jgi:hypothetical protein
MKKFSLANEEQIFVKKETTEGTLVYPASTDTVLAVGAATSDQETEFLPDGQVRARRSRLSPIKGRTNPGAWNFTTYVKPYGTLGYAPETDVLLTCALGKRTPATDTPPTPIVYSLDSSSNLPSFSMLRKIGHTVFYMAGCTVNQAQFNVAGNDIANIAWSGQFMKWYYAGEDTLKTTTSGGQAYVIVNDPFRFTATARINIGSLTNGGLGYLITSVNYTTGQVNISPSLPGGGSGVVTAGATIAGWYPSTQVERGLPVHGKLGIITIDSINAVILTSQITLTNNIKYYTDEKNGQWYPTVYGAPGFRDVSGSLSLYFYKNTSQYFYKSSNQIQDALIVPAGSVAGKIMEISCPRIEYKSPKTSGNEEIMIALDFTAVSSTAGDDELTVTFK